jgi:hypothetical protein
MTENGHFMTMDNQLFELSEKAIKSVYNYSLEENRIYLVKASLDLSDEGMIL